MGRSRKQEADQIDNFVELRRAAIGLSRQQLADLVGVHYQTISYIERGEYSPSLALAIRLAKALGSPVEQLFQLRTGIQE